MSSGRNNHFINPYNFIPLHSGTKKIEPKKGASRYTGVIDYSVYTKTPLFIPNTSHDDALNVSNLVAEKNGNKHKSYDFFSYTNLEDKKEGTASSPSRPVIPGSEIRGMIRSNYEILTDSCMSSLDTDMELSKRTSEPFKPGLIQNNKGVFSLYQAERFPIRKKLYQAVNGDKKKIELTNEFKMQKTNIGLEHNDRYLMMGEPGPVALKDYKYQKAYKFTQKAIQNREDGVSMPIELESLKCLDLVLQEYSSENRYEEYRNNFEDFKKKKDDIYWFPVYYSLIVEDGDLKTLFLSPAQITREMYINKLDNIAKDYKPCKSLENMCPACSLFGMLNTENNVVRASSLRFSDLGLDQEGFPEDANDYSTLYGKIKTLPELSSSKLNNMEFYLKRPEGAIFWTYDYWVDINGKIHSYTPTLNGRKFYWHKMIKDSEIPSAKIDIRNMTIRPLKSGVKFTGKVYFKDVTDEELNLLIWILNAGEDANVEIKDKTHGYKLGAAKPLGLGSISIKTNYVNYREVSIDSEKKSIEIINRPYRYDHNSVNVDEKIQNDFMKMTDFYAVDSKKVRYPFPKGQEHAKGFAWFTDNHNTRIKDGSLESGMARSRNTMAFKSYMEAMDPCLKDTIDKNTSDSSEKKNSGTKYKKGQIVEISFSNYKHDVGIGNADGTTFKVFECPNNLTQGNMIKVEITKIGENNWCFGRYKK